MASTVKIVVTRERGHNESLREWLDPPFAEVPATRTLERGVEDVRAELAETAPGATWLVVTSSRSVGPLSVGRDLVSPSTRVAAVGEATARALLALDWPVDVVGSSGALSLLEHLDTSPILVVGAESARPELPAELRRRGIEVRVVSLYRTEARTLEESERRVLREADVVVVGAPSAWRVLRADIEPRTFVVVPGETTRAEVARDHQRVLVGGGADWPAVRDLVTKRFHAESRGEFPPGGDTGP